MKSWLLSMVPCQQDIIIYHNQKTSSYINQPQWLFRGSSHLSWIIYRKDFSPSSNFISQGEPHTCGFGVFTPTTPTPSPLLPPWFLFHAHAGCSAKGAPWLSLGSHTKASPITQGPHSKAGRSLGSGRGSKYHGQHLLAGEHSNRKWLTSGIQGTWTLTLGLGMPMC